MKKLLTILFFVAFSASLSNAQSWRYYRNEFSLGVGATTFLGELGGNPGDGVNGLRSVKDIDLAMTRYVFSVGYRYIFNPYFAGRVNFYQARVDGDDQKTENPFRKNRNLHFKSPISELGLAFEVYPFKEYIGHPYRLTGARGKKNRHLSPYLMAGVSGFYFNPKAQFERSGSWVKLHDFQTEGVDYNRLQISIPYGFGLKYSINRTWSIGFEYTWRKTFTDYIDDASDVYIDQADVAAHAQANGLNVNHALYFADPNLGLPEATSYPGKISAGEQRGDNTDLDSFNYAIFSVHYRLLKGRFNLPKF